MIKIRKASTKQINPILSRSSRLTIQNLFSNVKKNPKKTFLKVGSWNFPEPDTPTKKQQMKDEARNKRLKHKFNFFYTPYSPGINLKK
jgi:hypothetical protein